MLSGNHYGCTVANYLFVMCITDFCCIKKILKSDLFAAALLARACMTMGVLCSRTTRKEPPTRPSSTLRMAWRRSSARCPWPYGCYRVLNLSGFVRIVLRNIVLRNGCRLLPPKDTLTFWMWSVTPCFCYFLDVLDVICYSVFLLLCDLLLCVSGCGGWMWCVGLPIYLIATEFGLTQVTHHNMWDLTNMWFSFALRFSGGWYAVMHCKLAEAHTNHTS